MVQLLSDDAFLPSYRPDYFLDVRYDLPREFTRDGRVIITTPGPYTKSYTSDKNRLHRAKLLALMLDVFSKDDAAVREGRTWRLKLYQVPVEQRGEKTVARAYGVTVPFPLDIKWFLDHAVWDDTGRAFPMAQPTKTHPHRFPRHVGIGLAGVYDTAPSAVPEELNRIVSSCENSMDQKWQDVGFVSGRPWDGTMPELTKDEARVYTGVRGLEREFRDWSIALTDYRRRLDSQSRRLRTAQLADERRA